MADRKLQKKSRDKNKTVRASVSLSAGTYRMLAELAKQKRVSTSWVLRDAAERYIADQ